MKNLLLVSLMTFLLAACSSKAPRQDSQSPEYFPTYESKPVVAPEKVEEVIDIRALQTSLRLDPSKEELGFKEKTFNTCQVGAGYSSSQNCRSLTMAVIHFQLMCRDSEGTVSEEVTSANLQPIANQPIKWTLGQLNNQIYTDSNGYGQIVFVASQSQRTQRLRLTSAKDFLAIRANEVRSLVAPKNWCL